MNPPKKRQNTITRYAIEESHLIGDYKEKSKDYDLMQAVLVCLGSQDQERFEGLLKLLGTLLSNEEAPFRKKQVLENDFGIAMSELLEKEVMDMCNLSEGLVEKGIEKGIVQGFEKGIEQGIEQGVRVSFEILAELGMPRLEAVGKNNTQKYGKIKSSSYINGIKFAQFLP